MHISVLARFITEVNCIRVNLCVSVMNEYRLKVSESRILRKIILGFKSDELTGEWRRLRNEKLYDL